MFRRPKRLIIPQYTVPKNLSLIAAAELLGDGKRALAAQLIDFAVRKVVTVARPTDGINRPGFVVTLTGPTQNEGPDEKAILVTLFGNELVPGSSFALAPGRNRELGARLKGPHRWIVARLVHFGLARENRLLIRLSTPWRAEPIVPTEAAYPLVDYLWGMHDYIQLAEKDRFDALQSPDGALRREPLGDLEVLVLYEKLLPYAVLFNLEKQWMRELDLRYQSLPPDLSDLVTMSDLASVGLEIAVSMIDLSDLVDFSGAADGVGAIFGGIGGFLGDIDFPDFDFPDFG